MERVSPMKFRGKKPFSTASTFTPTGARAMAFDEIKGRFTRVRVGRVVRLLRYL
jgi:hypothetical protein